MRPFQDGKGGHAKQEATAGAGDAAHLAKGGLRTLDAGVVDDVEGGNQIEGAIAKRQGVGGGPHDGDTAGAGGQEGVGMGIDADDGAVTSQPGGGATGAAAGIQHACGAGPGGPESVDETTCLLTGGPVPPMIVFDPAKLLVGLSIHGQRQYPSVPDGGGRRPERS